MGAPSGQVGRNWVLLKYIGEGDPPSRASVGQDLLLQSNWISAADIYSFIALPNKTQFELCFYSERALRCFLEIVAAHSQEEPWKNWEVHSSLPIDKLNIIIKFWTGRVADEDIEQYISRYCDILHPPEKPVDQFGIWYGIRKYRVKLRRNSDGKLVSLPNSISLGPYNGKITFSGQVQRCYVCNSLEHRAKDCKSFKCWKCGQIGHKGKECNNKNICSLCQEVGHSYFDCPSSYSNRTRAHGGEQAGFGNGKQPDFQREPQPA